MTDTKLPLHIAQYDPATMEGPFRALLGRWGVLEQSSPFYDYWQPILKDHRTVLDDLVMAFDGEAVIGLAQVNWRPTLDNKARSVTYFINTDQPKEQVARAIKQHLDIILAKRGLTTQVAFSPPEYADYNAFYEQIGFVHRAEYDSMRMIWDGGDYTKTAVAGLSIHHYDHDHPDPVIEAELATMFNRTFANEPACADLEGKDIRKLSVHGGMWFAYAREQATGTIVAYAECGVDGLFSAISVIRPYWGKGVAEWLAAHCMDHFRANGIDKLWSLVRTRNAASIRLHERMGWKRDGDGIYRYFFSQIEQT
jgi:GNAT superfamily N-acetyltransferase